MKDLYRIDEVCKMLDISRSTLYRKINAGEIKGINFGSRLTRIPREEITKMMEKVESENDPQKE